MSQIEHNNLDKAEAEQQQVQKNQKLSEPNSQKKLNSNQESDQIIEEKAHQDKQLQESQESKNENQGHQSQEIKVMSQSPNPIWLEINTAHQVKSSRPSPETIEIIEQGGSLQNTKMTQVQKQVAQCDNLKKQVSENTIVIIDKEPSQLPSSTTPKLSSSTNPNNQSDSLPLNGQSLQILKSAQHVQFDQQVKNQMKIHSEVMKKQSESTTPTLSDQTLDKSLRILMKHSKDQFSLYRFVDMLYKKNVLYPILIAQSQQGKQTPVPSLEQLYNQPEASFERKYEIYPYSTEIKSLKRLEMQQKGKKSITGQSQEQRRIFSNNASTSGQISSMLSHQLQLKQQNGGRSIYQKSEKDHYQQQEPHSYSAHNDHNNGYNDSINHDRRNPKQHSIVNDLPTGPTSQNVPSPLSLSHYPHQSNNVPTTARMNMNNMILNYPSQNRNQYQQQQHPLPSRMMPPQQRIQQYSSTYLHQTPVSNRTPIRMQPHLTSMSSQQQHQQGQGYPNRPGIHHDSTNINERFEQEKIIAKTFCKEGYGLSIARKFLGHSIETGVYNKAVTTIVRESYKKIEEILSKKYGHKIHFLNSQQFSLIKTPLVHCRNILNPADLNTYFRLIKMTYRIKTQEPSENQIFSLYKSILQGLNDRRQAKMSQESMKPSKKRR